MLKDRRVQVMLIPREQVEAVLSSFGRDDSLRPQSQNRQNFELIKFRKSFNI
jgi:hypothetical protein